MSAPPFDSDRAVLLLEKFYTVHDPSKTAADVRAIITKRQAKGAFTAAVFSNLCRKLEQKYGQSPLVFEDGASDDEHEYADAFDDGKPPSSHTHCTAAAAAAEARFAATGSDAAAGKEVRARHSAVIAAGAEHVWEQLRRLDFGWCPRVVRVAALGGSGVSAAVVGGRRTIEWADGSRWVVEVGQVSDSKRSLAFAVQSSAPGSGGAGRCLPSPLLVKMKVRRVTASNCSLLEYKEVLSADSPASFEEAAATEAGLLFGELRAALGCA
jgi:hypothetical protein